jgi:hypothetical protein
LVNSLLSGGHAQVTDARVRRQSRWREVCNTEKDVGADASS